MLFGSTFVLLRPAWYGALFSRNLQLKKNLIAWGTKAWSRAKDVYLDTRVIIHVPICN